MGPLGPPPAPKYAEPPHAALAYAQEPPLLGELVRVGAELVGLRVDELRERLEVGMRQLPRLQQLRLVHEVRCLLGRRRTKLLELLDEDGAVAELGARLPAGPEAAAVELARHVPCARVGRRGRRRYVQAPPAARRARRGPEVIPRVPPVRISVAVVVVLVQPRLVPGLPPRELRVEEVAVFGDHAAGLDALAVAHAPILPRRRPGLVLPQVGPEPVADAGVVAEDFPVLPRPEAVPPAPRIRAGVVERAGRRVAAQVVAGVRLAAEGAGGRAGGQAGRRTESSERAAWLHSPFR